MPKNSLHLRAANHQLALLHTHTHTRTHTQPAVGQCGVNGRERREGNDNNGRQTQRRPDKRRGEGPQAGAGRRRRMRPRPRPTKSDGNATAAAPTPLFRPPYCSTVTSFRAVDQRARREGGRWAGRPPRRRRPARPRAGHAQPSRTGTESDSGRSAGPTATP